MSASDCDIKRENANIDGDTAMGTMLKYGSEGAKCFYDAYVIPAEMAEAHRHGDIHIHDKDFYLLTTGLAPEESYFRIIKDTFQKYIDCLRVGGNRFVDYVLGFQTGNKDDIEKTDALEKAYNMAKEIKINE